MYMNCRCICADFSETRLRRETQGSVAAYSSRDHAFERSEVGISPTLRHVACRKGSLILTCYARTYVCMAWVIER